MSNNIIILCRSMSIWMVCVIIGLSILITYDTSNMDKKFYRFGPHDDFIILGFKIDNNSKYSIIIIYSILNTILRTFQHEILSPWLVNNIQDLEREQNEYIRKYAYEVTTVNTIYQWVDWVLYMNLLLSQIDMVIIEIIMNIIATNITTLWYLNNNRKKHINNSNPNIEYLITTI